jgi:hypothetical protein
MSGTPRSHRRTSGLCNETSNLLDTCLVRSQSVPSSPCALLSGNGHCLATSGTFQLRFEDNERVRGIVSKPAKITNKRKYFFSSGAAVIDDEPTACKRSISRPILPNMSIVWASLFLLSQRETLMGRNPKASATTKIAEAASRTEIAECRILSRSTLPPTAITKTAESFAPGRFPRLARCP